MEEKFKNILDEDEKIMKVYKPNKLKFSVYVAFLDLLVILFSALPCLLATISEGESSPGIDLYVSLLIVLAISLFVILLSVIFGILVYKNTYYAYTNKRIIVRLGAIGVDYKSHDLDFIRAITVNVSLLDKILRKNTGSISFGTPTGLLFKFSNISNPYDVYKELKTQINEAKLKLNENKNETI